MTATPDTLDGLTWSTDILGEGYECTVFELGKDPDTGDDARATLVRALPDSPTDQPALLWVHGMSDYFFQDHVAEHFVAQGYPFYALDLRGCGRSHKPGERWHYTVSMEHYFPELTRALELVGSKHGTVVPIAHSTGGLIVPLWADDLRRNDPQKHALLAGIILNSPWLDMQFSPVTVKLIRKPIDILGRLVPWVPLPRAGIGAYGQSISASAHGEWVFDSEMKPIHGHRKYFGWLRAILQGHKLIHSEEIDTDVPTLTLVSSHSYLNKPYSPAADTADTVLDVEQIKHWAPQLSKESTVDIIDGARHDVFLSELHAREAAGAATETWLKKLPAAKS